MSAAVLEVVDRLCSLVRKMAVHANDADLDWRMLHAVLVQIHELDVMMTLGASDEALERRKELSHAVEDDGMIVVGKRVANHQGEPSSAVCCWRDGAKFVEAHHMEDSLRSAMGEALFSDGLRAGHSTLHAVGALDGGVGIVRMTTQMHEAKMMKASDIDVRMRRSWDGRMSLF